MPKSQLTEAEALGRQAFLDGKPSSPVLNETVLNMIEGLPVGGGAAKIFKAFSNGWTAENLKD